MTSGTFNYNGTSAQTMMIGDGTNAIVYWDININNLVGATLNNNITGSNVQATIRVQTGTLNNGGFGIAGGVPDAFIVNNGATFNVTGAALPLSGFGTYTFGATSNTNYSLNGAQAVFDVPSPGYGNITFSIGNVKTVATGLDIQGNLTINSSATFATSAAAIHIIQGNWINNGGTFDNTNATINFNNTTADQAIQGTAATQTFNNLTLAKSTRVLNISGSTTLAQVSGTLTMTSGNINTGSGTLELGISTATPGTLAYTAGNIIGCFRRWFNTTGAKTYPLGTAAGAGNAAANRNALVTFTDLTNGALTGCFVGSAPGNTGLPLAESGLNIDNTYTEGYWSLDVSGGLASTNYALELFGSGFTSQGTFDSDIRIIKRTTSGPGPWMLNGTHVAAASNIAKRSALSGFSHFALAKDKCKGLSLSASDTDITCFGSTNGTITVTRTGGNTPFTYAWNDGPTSQNRSGLASGTYIVTVTDMEACTVSATATITAPALLNATVMKTDITCFGANNGTITVSAPMGGYGTYEFRVDASAWQAIGTLGSLTPGIKTVEIRDAANILCVVSLGNQTILEPSILVLSKTVNNALCNGGSTGSISSRARRRPCRSA